MKHPLSLDQLFGSRLRAYESSVPPDMFDRIFEERNKQKVGFWYTAGGKILGLSSILLFMAGVGGSSITDGKSIPYQKKSSTPLSLPFKQPPAFAIPAAPGSGMEIITEDPKGALSLLNKPVPESARPTLFDLLKETGHKNLSARDARSAAEAAAAPGAIEKPLFPENHIPLKSAMDFDISPAPSTPVLRLPGTPAVDLENRLAEKDFTQEGRVKELLTLTKGLNFLFLPNKDSLTLQGLISKMAKPGPGLGCPSFTSRNTLGNEGWYFDIYGAPELAFREFKDRNSENSPYAKARDSMERPWYAFSAGMRASYVFNSGFAIRAGLIYAQNNEVFTYNNPAETRVITVIDSIFDAGGKLTGTQTRQEKVVGVHSKITYNRYRSVDVPIQLGYEWSQGENNTWSVNGGVNLNILTWRKADILGTDYLPLSITSNFDQKNVSYKSNIGLSLYGSVAYYRQIGETTQLMIEPHITYGLSSLSNDNYPVSHRYTYLGLIVGLRWKL